MTTFPAGRSIASIGLIESTSRKGFGIVTSLARKYQPPVGRLTRIIETMRCPQTPLKESHARNASASHFSIEIAHARGTHRGLPYASGFEFVPILFVTDDHAPAVRLTSFESGADTCLLRPFAPGELLAQVQAFLRIKELHTRLSEKTAEIYHMNRRLQQELACAASLAGSKQRARECTGEDLQRRKGASGPR